jgi:hypothetical protein
MGRVRPFQPDDIPQVADLSWSFLYGREGSRPPELEAYLQQLYFLSPWSGDHLPSLVYEDDRGMIVGFLGVVARRMSLEATPLLVAFGSNFIVHPQSRATPAGLQLVRAFFSGGQDLSLSDTANHASQTIWAGFGGTVAAMYGMHWSRPLRPSLYALHAVSRFGKGTLSNALVRGSRPLCRVIDSLITKVPPIPVHEPALGITEEELDVDTLLTCLSATSASYSLKPDCDRNSLIWLLDFMGQMKAYGDLRRVALRDESGKLAGYYIYYMKKDGVGEVVHMGASGRSTSKVLDHLFHDASTRGAIALHGRLEIRSARQFSGKFCFFFSGSDPLLVHSRKPELVRLFQTGDAFFTRLDGEWCLKFGAHAKPRNPSKAFQFYGDNGSAHRFQPGPYQDHPAGMR